MLMNNPNRQLMFFSLDVTEKNSLATHCCSFGTQQQLQRHMQRQHLGAMDFTCYHEKCRTGMDPGTLRRGYIDM